MTLNLSRNRYIFLLDIIFIILAAPLCFLIRFDVSPLLWRYGELMVGFGVVSLLLKPIIYWIFGLYRKYWRYASIRELQLILLTVTVSSLVMTVLFLVILLPYGVITTFPRSILVIDWLLQLIFVGGVRFLIRVSGEGTERRGITELGSSQPETRVLVVGAGDAGAMIVRGMQHNFNLGYRPIAFVDDDPEKIGKHIRNVPVVGRVADIPQLVQRWQIQEVLIAIPSASGTVIRQITELCEQAGVLSKTIPGVYELVSGQVEINQIRNVEIDDLLRRAPVEVDETGIRAYLTGKRVLITGAGGSIGSELARQVASQQPGQLLLLGHGENSIFSIHTELKRTQPALDCQAIIADIRDETRINHLFTTYKPQVLFHAAAHKHVPLMETNVVEAISNNVIGTQIVLDAACATAVERLVLISSDKAVNPVNIMGTTKRVAELLVQRVVEQQQRNFAAVRFGNVLGSRGSVVPLFRQQIAQGGPVTVTHPEMERFFMTIPEAVHLVLQAGALGDGGEIFVLDMGQPIKIVDLARDMITLSGLQIGEDIKIVFTGIRPGEKLSEQLYASSETVQPTTHPKVMAVKTPSLHNGHLPRAHLIEQLKAAVIQQDEAQIQIILTRLLPEREPPAISGTV